MARYLLQVSYTLEGVKGLVAEGGSSRVATVEKLAKAAGGKVESFYFSFGGDDAYVIVELPDNVTAAGISLAVGAAGGARLSTVVLLTAEEIDAATKIKVDYRAPGAK